MSEAQSFDELIKGVRSGDDQAAADLVRLYEPAIRRAIRYRMRDTRLNTAFDSMDVCQSVMASFFIRAAAGQYDLDSPDGIMQLLVGMAKKKLALQVRRQHAKRRDNRRMAPNPVDEAPIADGGATPSRHVVARELLDEVQRLLSEDDRKIVEWRQDGIEWSEIAARLNTTPEAVRKKFGRAIDKVAVELGLEEEDEAEE